ncbi:hypothetical protein [Ancylobacter mangrovi]|uniref:Lectin-like protein BA14k n=1 Tax=Ancylobacter mangrovi TaxID=2972472 RepID=A0A9X2T109_9HYPH|nr:hypothetical protein [Ancylobacter mangrovi]MCS0494227.1 hypothetical protein [Ancylobacter mangrovi]MCS0501046.1 hypothetical protein [Ancylobacter mangrovi]
MINLRSITKANIARFAALALAGATFATALPTPSQAGNNTGAAIAAGIVGGLVVGGLAASAANNYGPPPPPAYGPRYVPAPGPGYYHRSGYYRRPHCWTRTETYYNRWGRPYARDVRICR